MKVALTVNSKPAEADVPPRTSLADFIREHLLLTGTHIGCEHGICGACTVEINGEISRSCITYAVACDGANIRTIEGFDDDALMAQLRQAFTQAHALQCGYCTPGMLVAARDLIRRKAGLSRQQIRHEMSGNLCRCTGYVGIVDAIEQVMADVMERGQTPGASGSASANAGDQGSDPVYGWLGPAPGPTAVPTSTVMSEPGVRPTGSAPIAAALPVARAPIRVSAGQFENAGGVTRLSQSFILEHPLDAVWALMSDPEAVARCMPGAQIEGPPQPDGKIAGRITVKLGPIAASFSGAGTVTQHPAEYRQVIAGHGVDRKSGSRVSGSVEYRLSPTTGAEGSDATRVDLTIGYALTGMLAQLGRSGLARDLAQRIGEVFAQNVDARLGSNPGAATQQVRLSALSLLFAAIRARLRALLGPAET